LQNTLFYGDNLAVLRGGLIAEQSVDLIYLDPPFNSNRNYNVLFKSAVSGADAQAQIHAFTDTWEWSSLEYNEVVRSPRVPVVVKDALEAMIKLVGRNALTGYLVMMAARLAELHRALKPTGSLYLHCDPTASHYLKLILDAVFGAENFRNEFIWKRSSAHNDGKQGRKQAGRIHDTIFYYTKTNQWTWNPIYTAYDADYVKRYYSTIEPETGRRYWLDNLQAPGGASKGNPSYEVMGVTRYWRYTRAKMQALIEQGRIVQTAPGIVPRYKRYLDEMPGVPLQDVWTDIPPINSQAKEALGYPTQKPLALLERIVRVSSNPGDVVLDPFCGCGTAVVAAEKLGRGWLGIDITSLAIGVIEKRIRQTYPDASFGVVGLPDSPEDALELAARDKYEFQDWVVLKLGGQPIHEDAARPGKSKKGADGGIDGVIYFEDGGKPRKVIISVKGGQNVGVGMMRDLAGTVEREQAAIGVLVLAAEPTRPMTQEAQVAAPYESSYIMRGHEQSYPRLQIITAADLIAGKGVEMPPHYEAQTMQTATRGERPRGKQLSLLGGEAADELAWRTGNLPHKGELMTATLTSHHLGLVSYAEGLRLQADFAAQRAAGTVGDSLLLLEHPHTYTLGRSGKAENILLTSTQLAERGAATFNVDRGGDVTYHGPGQLVAYPILDLLALRGAPLDYPLYVRDLERVLIATVAGFGIVGQQVAGYSGLWVAEQSGRLGKLAAIGVHVNGRGISTHGLALNVNLDLAYFGYIVPCGIQEAGKGVTSLAALCGQPLAMETVAAHFVAAFRAGFGYPPE